MRRRHGDKARKMERREGWAESERKREEEAAVFRLGRSSHMPLTREGRGREGHWCNGD